MGIQKVSHVKFSNHFLCEHPVDASADTFIVRTYNISTSESWCSKLQSDINLPRLWYGNFKVGGFLLPEVPRGFFTPIDYIIKFLVIEDRKSI